MPLVTKLSATYLGFGLRDPDFLLLRDVLANTWKGGLRDHYAIMPDVGSGEVNYWRRHYGIHLIGYPTATLPNGKRNHGKLLELLDSLLLPMTPAAATKVVEGTPLELVLPLLRYANGLMRFEPANPELPLRVHSSKGWRYARSVNVSLERWDDAPAQTFLEKGPQRAVLLGLPGAGKTYALRQATSRLAQALHDTCLAQLPLPRDLVIPMLVDMKLYRGDLMALLETTLPTGVTFRELTNRFRVKVFLDSFNEMPRDQWDRGAHETDIPAFLNAYPTVETIIGSRTEDGLAKLDLPSYWLDEIDHDFLDQQLRECDIPLSGRFRDELRDLLSKPFYFQLVVSRNVQLPEQPHPRDLYHSFFSNLSLAFARRFGNHLDVAKALAPFAYEAVNRGEETLPVQILYQSLNKEMQSVGLPQPTAEVAGHWLVSQSVLLPYSGGRVALFHQSVTEFLAATELAVRFRAAPVILREKLSLNRWDQAILLTLGILPESEAPAFLEAVLRHSNKTCFSSRGSADEK